MPDHPGSFWRRMNGKSEIGWPHGCRSRTDSSNIEMDKDLRRFFRCASDLTCPINSSEAIQRFLRSVDKIDASSEMPGSDCEPLPLG
jgi:hypothetical protein